MPRGLTETLGVDGSA
uniref:Uncharacterized protein n=1 Tax=Anguilla anguilla TaxID=7936 RepID=A0A0E9RXZ0_ANGAN